jgi:putative ABC transport system permease protein
MLMNYLRSALRNIRKHKFHSIINISCLALGMACCILVMFWIRNDLQVDYFHKNLERLYRVETVETQHGSKMYIDLKTSFPVADALKNEFPEIEESARILKKGQKVFSVGDKMFKENSLAFVDPSFFRLFTFSFVEGDPGFAFRDIHSIILTKSLAEKYFGSKDPMGKTIVIDNKFRVVVRGLVEDIPADTHFNRFYSIDCFVPLESQGQYEKPMTGWDEFYLVTYVLLKERADYHQLNEKLTGYLGGKHPSAKKYQYDLMLHPVKHIELYGINGEETGINVIFIFMALAIAILIIACLNYINLATAFSLRRAKEIGIRKVLGTNRKGIIYQFLLESVVLSLAAFFLALLMVDFVLPLFNTITGKNIQLTFSGLISQIPWLVGLVFVTSLLAGSYPAFVLSSLNPIAVLRKKGSGMGGKWSLRKVLVTLQILLAAMFVTGTLVVYSQFNYMVKTHIGHDDSNIICLNRGGLDREQFEVFRNDIRNHTGIKSVGSGGVIPGYSTNFAFRDTKFQGIPLDGFPLFHGLYVDHDYFKTLGIAFLKGKGFSPNLNNSNGVVINEMVADLLSKDDPVGETLEFFDEKKQILGVVNNFPVWSLKFAMYPIVAVFNPEKATFVYIKIDPAGGSAADTVGFIENKWRQYFPGYPFEYNFLEDLDRNLYLNEIYLLKISGYLTFLAVFICCLGNYGLISYIVQSQQKAISIRKVMGAGSIKLVSTISSGLLKSALIAVICAIPLIWIFMSRWLQNYVFRIHLTAGLFMLGIVTVFFFTLFPLLPNFLRINRLNPIKFLRED